MFTHYIGIKDGRVFITYAFCSDEAYLNIGELMSGQRQDDPGNVDLDFLGQLPSIGIHRTTVELKPTGDK